MPVNSPMYCEPADIKLGDLQPPRYVTIADEVQSAANDMNAYIGQIYKLPLALDPQRIDHLPDILLLNKINRDLATGNIILAAAAGGEDDNLHAYGKRLVDNAEKELARIAAGRTVIEGAEPIEVVDQQPNGPIITNRDEFSYVDTFYRSKGTMHSPYDTWGVNLGSPSAQ